MLPQVQQPLNEAWISAHFLFFSRTRETLKYEKTAAAVSVISVPPITCTFDESGCGAASTFFGHPKSASER